MFRDAVTAIAAIFVLLLLVAPGAVAEENAALPAPMILPVDPAPLVAETGEGEHSFTVEIADSDSERSRGLMHRPSLDENHGMLFVFERTRRVSFWMQNTPLPLDLIFIGEDGRVEAIMQGEPFSTAPISPRPEVRFVLEVEAGTAQKAGIDVGDRMRHPRIENIGDEG